MDRKEGHVRSNIRTARRDRESVEAPPQEVIRLGVGPVEVGHSIELAMVVDIASVTERDSFTLDLRLE